MRSRIALVIAALLAATPVLAIAATELTEQVTPIASPEGVSAFAPSPAADRVAYVTIKLRKKTVVLDDKPGQTFDEVRTLGDKGAVLFSANGKHITYVARLGQSWSLVLDTTSGPALQSIDSTPRFSDDGSAVACIGTRDAKHVLVILNPNGGEPVIRDLPDLGDRDADAVVLSADLKHVAHIAASGDGSVAVMVDGKASEKFSAAEKPVFSADGKRCGFLAKGATNGNGDLEEWIVVDGNKAGPFHDLSSFTFSPDSQHYAAIRGATGGGGPVMPAMPGSTVADKAGVIVDGKLIAGSYDAVNAPLVFSPDGQRLAFATDTSAGRAWIVDGQPQPPFQNVHALKFSADSRHFAYGAESAAGDIVVLDGKPGPTVRDVANDFALTFSPDSNHLAYVGVDAQGAKVPMLDGNAIGSPSRSSSPVLAFSPDSKHLVSEEAKKLSIDGIEVKQPFLVAWPVVFDSGDRCHLVITQADKSRGHGASRSFGRLDITIH
jgi:Tol biopolymer transport system component